MTTMLEKAKAAILTELEDDHFGAHEAGIAARAALLAIREPAPGVLDAGAANVDDVGTTIAAIVWEDMIDAILNEKPETGS